MMTLDFFMHQCKRMGIDPFSCLIPASIFAEIDNEAEYLISDVAILLGKSTRQIRRRFEKGEIAAFRKRPYSCFGIDLKRFLFKEFYHQIISKSGMNKH